MKRIIIIFLFRFPVERASVPHALPAKALGYTLYRLQRYKQVGSPRLPRLNSYTPPSLVHPMEQYCRIVSLTCLYCDGYGDGVSHYHDDLYNKAISHYIFYISCIHLRRRSVCFYYSNKTYYLLQFVGEFCSYFFPL